MVWWGFFSFLPFFHSNNLNDYMILKPVEKRLFTLYKCVFFFLKRLNTGKLICDVVVKEPSNPKNL